MKNNMGKNFEVWCLVLLLIGIVGLIQNVESKYMEYNTGAKIDPSKLNVHLVPHTHDDVGWLKTVDQYYVGSNNSIQNACVQNVLDSLIPALLADKNRKFIYVEQAFFQRWWRNQSPAMLDTVKGLVNEGRLEFINGGWCMHDEAATHYIDMIDQTTLGHRYLKDQFNVTPRIGWQIDPFGHSAIQAYLLGAEVGFDSFFFGRIDYQDRIKRKVDKTLEVVWQGSKSLGSTSQIFAGAFPENYEPPKGGFYYEIGSDSPVVQDDTSLFDYNVGERVNAFVAAAYAQANITRTNHVMFTMGTDFQYQYARSWFRNMDKLIHYVNEDGRVNALYSTPSIYTDAKYASNESWPLKTDDYFPYADRINGYWTGYFTSRPALKRYVRELSGYYLAARQLEFFKGKDEAGPTTDLLADALAIAQHHDAVSGTSKQHVANDYAKRLTMGYKEAADVVSASLALLTGSSLKSGSEESEPKFKQCPLLNITYCPPTEVDLSLGKRLVVVIYNSLGWKRDDIVKIPVISADVAVRDSAGKEIVSQIVPVVNASLALRNFYATANVGSLPAGGPLYWLAFKATVPPLGFSTYTISSSKRAVSAALASVWEETSYGVDGSQHNAVEVGPGNLKLVYSGHSGKLNEYIQGNVKGRNTVKFSVDQSYSYYIGDDGSKDPPAQLQASGAYIFRPNSTFPIQSREKTPLTVLRGPLFDEAHQSISPWIYQVTRVYKEKQHAEVEFIVGPIPIDDKLGKEVVTKIETGIKSNKTFYTDSNGRDYLKRIRDYRSDWELQVNQPVAGNYYPINHGIYLQDDSTEFSVLVDRAIGGSSILDGQLELMVHRRLLRDDGRGVAEALNETTCIPSECKGLTIQGKYHFKFDPIGEGAKWRRSFGQEIYSPLLLAFSEQDGDSWNNFQVPTFTGIDPSYSLPDNVAMITLEELADGTVLLRLAHLYEVGEDKDLSAPAKVELKKLFPNKKINKITEMALSANQKREDMEKKRLVWKAENSSDKTPKATRGGPVDPSLLVAELFPMEIRTFTLKFGKKLSTTAR